MLRFHKMCFLVLAISAFSTCQKPSSRDSGIPVQSLSLADTSSIKAKFVFPNSNQQMLAAPNGSPLEGAWLITSPTAFNESLDIEISEAFQLVGKRTEKELEITESLSAAGPAIVFESDSSLDSNNPMIFSLPLTTTESSADRKNLVVLYRVYENDLGGKRVSGMLAFDKVSRDNKTVKFSGSHFGVYQAAWYNGDPSKIKQHTSMEPIVSLSEAKAETPTEFFIRTPSGTVVGQTTQVSWGSSENAVSYDVAIANEKNCNNPIRQYLNLANLTRSVDTLPEGKYYACVSAVSSRGIRTDAKNNGIEFVLKYNQLGYFSYDGTKYFATSKPSFKWNESKGATKYNVIVSTSSGCTSPVETAITTSTSWTSTSSKTDGSYYLCVIAMDDEFHKQIIDSDSGRPAGEGVPFYIDTTMPGQFEILGLGGPSAKLTWSASSEAVFYNVVISRKSDCSEPVKTINRLMGSLTSLSLPGLSDGETYFICMESMDNSGNVRAAKNTRQAMKYDVSRPKIVNVTANPSAGTFAIGQSIEININFSEPVKLSNSNYPTLLLNSGGAAVYSKGSGTSTWTFQYTVSSSESSNRLEYLETDAFKMGGAVVTDSSGNAMNEALPPTNTSDSLGGSASIKIDGISPVVDSSFPQENAEGVAVNTEINLIFNEQIESGSVSAITIIRSSDSSDATKLFSSSYIPESKTLKFTLKPNTYLVSKAAYLIKIKGVRDLVGNTISEKSISFITK